MRSQSSSSESRVELSTRRSYRCRNARTSRRSSSREIRRQRALDPLEDRTPLGRGADEDESVVRDADERRRENGEQSLVVVAVLQQPEIGEQVDDLLLPEIASAGHPDRRQIDRSELLLEPLGVGARSEQQDDLAGRRGPDVDELADTARNVARLGPTPMETRVGVRLLVRHEKLEGCPEHRVAVPCCRCQGLEALAELLREQLVDRGEHLGPRAVVRGQGQNLRRGLAPVAEHRDVRMAKAVDGLELVADEEQLLRGSGAEEVDQVGLEAVGVLELVDHDRAETKLLGLSDRVVVLQELTRPQLQILEIESGFAILGSAIGRRESGEQLLQELAIARCEILEGASTAPLSAPR